MRIRSFVAGLAVGGALVLGSVGSVAWGAPPADNPGQGAGQGHGTGKPTTAVTTVPQPPSNADFPGDGANTHGPYDSTRDGSPSGNGSGDGKAVGQPCAGCVGKADNKNPPGQLPGPQDGNAGYECDRNHGIGQSNPAHTGCTTVPTTTTVPSTTTSPPTSTTTSVTTSTSTPATTAVTTSTTSQGAVAGAAGTTSNTAGLSYTGANLAMPLAAGAALLATGGGLLLITRRRAKAGPAPVSRVE